MTDDQNESKGKQAAQAGAMAALKATGGTGIAVAIVLGFIALMLVVLLGIALLASQEEENEEAQGVNCSPSSDADVTVPAEYEEAVEDAADEAGLPVSIVAALFDQESGYDPNAVSPVGARNIAQMMPETWEQYGEGEDPNDPLASIAAGGRYLKAVQDEIDSVATTDQERIEFTLAAYNAGPGAVQQYDGVPPYQETQDYVQIITGNAQIDFSEDCKPPGGTEIGDLGTGEWTLPLPGGQSTSGYGYRGCIAGIECNEYVSTHHGLDLSTGGGATVVAPTDIEITATGTNQYQGEYIIARMTEDPELVFQFHHCHSGSTQVSEGDTAAVETELCTEGDTGNAAGAHLHFQINEAEADDTQPTYEHSTDPEPILVEKGVL